MSDEPEFTIGKLLLFASGHLAEAPIQIGKVQLTGCLGAGGHLSIYGIADRELQFRLGVAMRKAFVERITEDMRMRDVDERKLLDDQAAFAKARHEFARRREEPEARHEFARRREEPEARQVRKGSRK